MKTIEEAAKKYAKDKYLYIPDMIFQCENHFEAGVEFAQRWIPIEEELPEKQKQVIVKLENIGDGVNEIKADMKNVKEDMKGINVRLVRMEQQVKVLNKTVFKDGASNE